MNAHPRPDLAASTRRSLLLAATLLLGSLTVTSMAMLSSLLV